MRELLEVIREGKELRKVVALGECGLGASSPSIPPFWRQTKVQMGGPLLLIRAWGLGRSPSPV